ncbi:MAG: YaeQ family protein [Reyranellaceae bacterium]
MAIKATIYKAQLQLADMDRGIYADHALTLARHPSETDERLMVRLLAFALNAPADNDAGALEFGAGLSDADEPDLWQRDLTGAVTHWIEIGQPDERRLLRAAGRAGRVSVIVYSAAAPIWWKGIDSRIARASNIAVWQIPAHESQALAKLAERGMQIQCNVQDGTAWIGSGKRTVDVTPVRLK